MVIWFVKCDNFSSLGFFVKNDSESDNVCTVLWLQEMIHPPAVGLLALQGSQSAAKNSGALLSIPSATERGGTDVLFTDADLHLHRLHTLCPHERVWKLQWKDAYTHDQPQLWCPILTTLPMQCKSGPYSVSLYNDGPIRVGLLIELCHTKMI